MSLKKRKLSRVLDDDDTTPRNVLHLELRLPGSWSYGLIDRGCLALTGLPSSCIKRARPLPMYSQVHFSRYLISYQLHCPLQAVKYKTSLVCLR